jgi:hypothetical protein
MAHNRKTRARRVITSTIDIDPARSSPQVRTGR